LRKRGGENAGRGRLARAGQSFDEDEPGITHDTNIVAPERDGSTSSAADDVCISERVHRAH
jgi:hypothetical protein